MYNPFTLSGKTILITGASSGIGRATAIECSKMGANIVITGRNPARLQETFDLLEVSGKHVLFIADLDNNEEILSIVGKTPPIDGLVHCAGIIKTIPFQFIKKEYLSAIMQINFLAPVLITKELLKNKKIKNNASIVFISSIEGVYCSSVANSMYAASKGAINGVVKAMAVDLSGKGIRVNSVNPGLIKTSILSEGIITSEQLQQEMKKYPLKRFGKPEEVAYSVIYLLSDSAQWITGSNLLIDGGVYIIIIKLGKVQTYIKSF